MNLTTLGVIIISVSLSAFAQIAFKFGVAHPITTERLPKVALVLLSPGVITGLSLYGIGTLLWLYVLSRVDVSQAYPFVGVGFLLTAIMGTVFFGEHISMYRAFGMVLVIAGVYLIARN